MLCSNGSVSVGLQQLTLMMPVRVQWPVYKNITCMSGRVSIVGCDDTLKPAYPGSPRFVTRSNRWVWPAQLVLTLLHGKLMPDRMKCFQPALVQRESTASPMQLQTHEGINVQQVVIIGMGCLVPLA